MRDYDEFVIERVQISVLRSREIALNFSGKCGGEMINNRTAILSVVFRVALTLQEKNCPIAIILLAKCFFFF